LTYHEFFCFIHLITSVTRGARMPSLQEGLPPQLLESLMNLEPLEILVAEREESRSRSRSVSPMPGFLSGPTPGGTPRGHEQRTFTEARWAPSRREKRKYASLFERTDWDKDGFISQSEAFQLAQRSGLDPTTLETAWGLSDVERDGMLTYHEFFCFIHLITSVTRGARMPSLQEGLPPQLLESLMNLEPLEILVAEREESRSRSRSRSPSPAIPSFLPGTPAVGTPRPSSAKAAPEPTGFAAQAPLSPDSEPSQAQGFPSQSSAADGFSAAFGPDGAGSLAAFNSGGFGEAFGAEAFGDAFGGPTGDGFGAESRSESPKKKGKEAISTDFFQETFDDPFRTSQTLAALAAEGADERSLQELARRFQRTLAADREVSKQISEEMHVLAEELRMVQDAAQQVEQQNAQEARQQQQLDGEQKGLTQQLAEQQHRLMELRDESRALNLENLSMRRDRKHLSEEVEFLQSTVGSERRALESLEHMNHIFDSYNKEMEATAELLTRQRKELPVAKEQQQLRQEERHNNELRNLLERRKREHASLVAQQHEVHQKHQLIRAMQSDDIVAVSALKTMAPPEGHTWATSLLKDRKL